jgi:hypothetical protein
MEFVLFACLHHRRQKFLTKEMGIQEEESIYRFTMIKCMRMIVARQ